jgi:glycosidase
MIALLPLMIVQAQDVMPYTFVYQADGPLKRVNVAGSFNNWNRDANPMKLGADGRTWTTSIGLPFGKHQYKFVLDGERWITDPRAARNEDDGGGNTNSVLVVMPPDYGQAASPTDGVTAKSALKHLAGVPNLNYDRGRLTFTFRARPNDLQKVELVANGKPVSMTLAGQDDLYALYTASVGWNRRSPLRYSFRLTDGKENRVFGQSGLGSGPFVIEPSAFKPFEVPGWVERSVFYQIFPDRFANGDKTNDPQDVQAWDAKPTWFNRYGGDIAGVRRRVPYLKQLGVSSVYFNPVFKSPSNHRYDAEDFRQIDPQFGSNAEFRSLTTELKGQGIRTVMDFVFNHTATTFGPFLDLREKGAESRYRDWYFPKSFPIQVKENPNYEAWFGFPSMPKLNVMNPETNRYLLDLVGYWRQQAPGLAGLRLDVANEVDVRFWRDLRRTVKAQDPQMWIVGEVWGDGTPWLGGDQWDSVMNYQFRDACLRFIAEGKTSPDEFMNRLMRVHTGYAPQVSRNMMNLLSSHDTPRFLTLAGNDERLHRMGAVVQFTWVGAPSIYYGEELGMQGGADPDNRRGMEWDKANDQNPMLQFYRRLIRMRNGSRALQSGDPIPLKSDNSQKTVAYARTLGNDVAIVVLNRSEQPRTISLTVPAAARGKGLVDHLSGRRHRVTGSTLSVSLGPLESAVLLQGPQASSSTAKEAGPAPKASPSYRASIATHSVRSNP